MTIAEILKALRAQRGWTLREVADRAGVSHSYLSQVESGKIKQPSPRVLRRLAAAYEADHQTLMIEAGYMDAPPGISITPYPFFGAARLTPEQMRLVQQVINALLEGSP